MTPEERIAELREAVRLCTHAHGLTPHEARALLAALDVAFADAANATRKTVPHDTKRLEDARAAFDAALADAMTVDTKRMRELADELRSDAMEWVQANDDERDIPASTVKLERASADALRSAAIDLDELRAQVSAMAETMAGLKELDEKREANEATVLALRIELDAERKAHAEACSDRDGFDADRIALVKENDDLRARLESAEAALREYADHAANNCWYHLAEEIRRRLKCPPEKRP